MNAFSSKSKKAAGIKQKLSSSVTAASATTAAYSSAPDKKPQLLEFLRRRDFIGAAVLLEFQRQTGDLTPQTLPMLGYAAFHGGDYEKAHAVYRELIEKGNPARSRKGGDRSDRDDNDEDDDRKSHGDGENDDVGLYHLFAACCLYYMGQYKEAEEEARNGPSNRLQNRILLHCAIRENNEERVMAYLNRLTDSTEDQLSLAAYHYHKNRYQEATDIYKKMLLEYRDYLAIQVYVAACYYKLDYYDVALEILSPYIAAHPDSAIAVNLKACNLNKLFDGKAAESELKSLLDVMSQSANNFDSDLIKHNLVTFRNGENALSVLPPLVDVIPEARLNLVIHHLKLNEIQEAAALLRDLEPQTPPEYILKGIVNALIGQEKDSKEHLKMAQQFFHVVGASASECNTIPGRQCMASCFFLLKQMDEVLVYLQSIKPFCANDNNFHWNYGITLASLGHFIEAEEAFHMIMDDKYINEYIYQSWLCRCYIMNGKARDAWELYLRMESNTDSFHMLQLIGNDCYRVGSFYYACKAFDVLERLEPHNEEYWNGKKGAAAGCLQLAVAKMEKKEVLRDVVTMLRSNVDRPEADVMIRVIRKWGNENGINIA